MGLGARLRPRPLWLSCEHRCTLGDNAWYSGAFALSEGGIAQNHLKLQEYPAFQESEEFQGNVGRYFGQTGSSSEFLLPSTLGFPQLVENAALGWDRLYWVGPDDQEASGLTGSPIRSN